MEITCNSDSITCKVASGIAAVVLAGILFIILKCFKEKLRDRLEKDIGANRKKRVTPCFSVSDHSVVLNENEEHVDMVGISTNTISHTAGNAWSPFASNGVPNPMCSSTTTVVYHAGPATMSSHSVIHHNTGFQYQNPPPSALMKHNILTVENLDGIENRRQIQNVQQQTSTLSTSQEPPPSESQEQKKCCVTTCIWRFIYFFLMSAFLYDWCMDVILSVEYYKKGEMQNTILTLAPCLISVLITTPFLLYIAEIYIELTCISVLLLVGFSPFAKVFIYGWMVVFGEQSWFMRWYLHALTLLQLAEVSIEGIPQLIFEGDLFLTEKQTFYKGIGRTEMWTMIVSLFAVAVSITSVTTTIEREEDVREIYDEKLKERNPTENEDHYWEEYKTKNTCLWYFYAVVVFLGKSFEYIPRGIIYIMFAEEFGLKALGYFIGVYLLIYICFSIFCFNTIITNDKSIKVFAFISIVVGPFANLFFCYEWLFRLRWAKKYFYFRYYILFYAVNLALGISNMLSSGKRDFHIVFGFVTVLCQPLLFLLRMWLREKMSENIK